MPIVLAGAGSLVSPTLADVERELAPRVGPYYLLTVASSPSATSVTVTELASTVTQEDKANLWLLWRTGTAADRVRQVASGPDSNGTLTVDRAWGVQPTAGTVIELHALHPTTQLRAAVLLGLQKCYVESREEFTVATLDAEIDLTSHFPWLTQRKYLRSLKYRWTASASWKALPVGGYEAWEADGHLWVALDYAQVLGVVGQSLLVEGFRPAVTLVNGLTVMTGPTLDADILAVELPYAAAAAHTEAWRIAKERLKAAAAAGYQDSQKTAASTFTQEARNRVRRPKPRVAFRDAFAVNLDGARSA